MQPGILPVSLFPIEADVLTPIPSGIAFILLVYIALGKDCNWRHYAALGLAVSAPLLTKLANLPLLFMMMVLLLWKAIQSGRPGLSKASLVNIASLIVALAVPLGLWASRNWVVLGDWSGTARKIEVLGWKYKPLSEILPHPIFSLAGFGYFLHETFVASFL